jgi:PAS domain S-box-containing protein
LQRARITGPFGYIVKPFKEIELRTNIEIALYRHKMERELKESRQWYAATLESIGDAVIATDTKGFIRFINPFAEALTGWKKKDAVGRPYKDVFNIVSEDLNKQVEDPIAKINREGSFFGLADHTVLISKQNARIPVDIIGTPVKDGKGNIIGNVMTFYDISERLRALKMNGHNGDFSDNRQQIIT